MMVNLLERLEKLTHDLPFFEIDPSILISIGLVNELATRLANLKFVRRTQATLTSSASTKIAVWLGCVLGCVPGPRILRYSRTAMQPGESGAEFELVS